MKNKGITLVALVITIIILLILAGITISQLTGSGLFENARLAEQKSKNAQEKEEGILGDYENKIGQYVDGSRETVTIDKEEYEKLVNTVNELKTIKPTGIKSDVYILNEIDTADYTTVTSMTGFTKTTDSENKISEYLSYSNETGYTVLKTGWYYVKLYAKITASTDGSDMGFKFIVNGKILGDTEAWSSGYCADTDRNTFSIYLNKGDVVYFNMTGNQPATKRVCKGYCYPMF